ncbi:MAG: alpha/beta hydrolase [Thiohalorhabdus sp.]|uniref:alpha/beta hydrolase n=1 Tax=Thiohalorhabdus sp. TaxID=3094134 RepID=UPI00397EC0C4
MTETQHAHCSGGKGEFLDLAGPAGPLEACLTLPPDEPPRAAVVLCHPHPRYGGTMNNKVVVYLARALRKHGAATLRFNFRGVGTSPGQFSGGPGEVADAAAAVDALATRFPDLPLWVAGFSFGSYAGLRAAAGDARVRRLVAVAPPVAWYDFAFLEAERRPVLIVQGGADEVVDPDDVRAFRARMERDPEWLCFPEADHFFTRQVREMADQVAARLFGAAVSLSGEIRVDADCNATHSL